MKTTLTLPDPLMVALKRRAAERGTSRSALAAELRRRGLDERPRTPYEPNFPVFHGTGPALIDLANRSTACARSTRPTPTFGSSARCAW